MICSVTHEAALAAPVSVILKIKCSIRSGFNDTYIKVYQMRILYGIALCITDSVRIVAGIAGGILGYHMPIVD